MAPRKLFHALAILAVPLLGALAVTAPAAAAAAPGQPSSGASMPGHALGSSPASAQTALLSPSAAAAYTWTGNAYYTYNTAGSPGVTVTANDPSAGEYTVDFVGLGPAVGAAGDVQVTPYDTADTCPVSTWNRNGANILAIVACYTPAGALDTAARDFDITLTKPHSSPTGVYDYSWVYQSASSLTLTGSYQYNSAHKHNSVRHLGAGRYLVFFPGPASAGVHGTVKVTPYGLGAGDCVLAGWRGTSKGVQVGVQCYSASGHLQNRRFDVVYASKNNVLGLNHVTDANVLDSGHGGISTPAVSYYSHAHASSVVIQYTTGSYEVALAGSEGSAAFGGDVQVNAVSLRDYRCDVQGWSQETTPAVYVSCQNAAGHRVSTPFSVQWIVP